MQVLSRLFLLLCLALFIQACKNDQPDSDASGESDSLKAQDSVVIELAGQDSVTVFALLDEAHDVEHRPSAMGIFVTAIDSIANSADAYWVYTVNDTTPQIAADKMYTRDGDRVKWLYRKQ